MKLDSLLNSFRVYRVNDRQFSEQQQHRNSDSSKHQRKKAALNEQELPPQTDQNARQVTYKEINEAIENIQKNHPEWSFELGMRGNEHIVTTRESATGKVLRVLDIEELLTIEMVYKTREEGAALPCSILNIQA